MARARCIVAAITALALGSYGACGAPVAWGQGLVAKQGARIWIDVMGNDALSACTLGYNDHQEGVSYTAAHCAIENEQFNIYGSVVYLSDSEGYVVKDPAGVVRPSRGFDTVTNFNDWAVIEWRTDVQLGPNTFGGNRIGLGDLAPGDTICYHGATTHGQTSGETCGEFIGDVGASVFYNAPARTRPGDSGGPVYVRGKGVIGVTSGNFGILRENSNRYLLDFEMANAMQDGALYHPDHIAQIMTQHAYRYTENAVKQDPVPPTQGPYRPQQPTAQVPPPVPPAPEPAPSPKPAPKPAPQVPSPVPPAPEPAPSPKPSPKPAPSRTTTTSKATPKPAPKPSATQTPASEIGINPGINQGADSGSSETAGIVIGVLALLLVLVPAAASVMGIPGMPQFF